MYPRTNYEMTEEDLKALLDAMKPVPVMRIGNYEPNQQLNANLAWAALGQRMGFDPMTVQPIPGKGNRFFSAVPSETPQAEAEREIREAGERRQREINRLNEEIAERQARLANLIGVNSDH